MRLDKVGKRYGIRLPWVVREVSLEIQDGGLVRFEGRNGSGKSTLLRVIAGVSEPSSGVVLERPVTGYVPERFPPALPFPARDYLAHVGRIHGLAGGALADRIDACLELLGAFDFADVPLRNMSKGMCQKVAVAQALLPQGGLLVLDEAWTGLDVEAKAALDEAVAERVAAGGCVVFVDHDPQRLAHLKAQRWRLEHGRAARVADDGGASQVRGAATGLVVIELTGYPAAGPGPADDGLAGDWPEPVAAPQPGDLPGVLSARWDGDRLEVQTRASSCDAVLRRLLAAGEDVHVVAVRPQAEDDR